MAAEVSNIDDLLTGSTSPSIPETPENIVSQEPEAIDYDSDVESPPQDSKEFVSPEDEDMEEEESESQESKKERDYDDYGNTKAAAKTYTEEEVNERINKAVRERLARGNNQAQQPTQSQVAQHAEDFEYNPDSAESWQTQLEKFVERTVSKMGQRQVQQQQRAQDEQIQAEFEDKFNRGMNRFSDFREVVGAQPVTDPMTYALRGLQDPAAFIYAASKRHPQELSRISQIADPVAQVLEMGKLEERMRKQARGTKAPKPVSRSREDSSLPVSQKKKEPTIEDLIARSEAKKKALFNQRRAR